MRILISLLLILSTLLEADLSSHVIKLAEALQIVSQNTESSALSKLKVEITRGMTEEEIAHMYAKRTHSFATFKEWKAACDALPYQRTVGNTYCHKALEWDAMDTALNDFFELMAQKYQEPNTWLDDAPQTKDPFLDPQAKRFFKPFVQKLIINPGDTVAIRGDMHGDVKSLIAYIDFLQKQGYLEQTDGFKIADNHKKDFYMLFLGDYVDRGNYGVEVIYTLMRLKLANPDNVFFVRGNHEDFNVNALPSAGGFSNEVGEKFGEDKCRKICRMYDFLPVALYLGCDNNFVQCCHGGMELGYNPKTLLNTKKSISCEWLTQLNHKDNAQALGIRCDCSNYKFKGLIKGLANIDFTDPSTHDYLHIGFMWNDFDVLDTADNKPITYKPGRGFKYGKWATKRVLQWSGDHENQVLGVLRAHQHSPGDDMWDSIMLGNRGLSTLWTDDTSAPTTFKLWKGIVCTFLVAPDTPYGFPGKGNYNFDAFGILTTSHAFENWKLTMHKNDVVPAPARRKPAPFRVEVVSGTTI